MTIDIHPSRPEEMSDIQWLVAMEEIRQLKARRDRYVDAHDWDGYAALHAFDHVSHHAPSADMGDAPEPWTSVDQMMDNIRRQMPEAGFHTAHHSYDPDFHFDTPTRARAIWAMTAATVTSDAGGKAGWSIAYGYYYESYEKREGHWLFTSRRWQRQLGVQSGAGDIGIAAITPTTPIKGRDAFDDIVTRIKL